MKKVIWVLMCLLLCFSFPVTSSAEVVSHNVFQPYYEKASEAKSELIINGTNATCKSTLRGGPDVTKLSPCKPLRNRASCGFGIHTMTRLGQKRCIPTRLRWPIRKRVCQAANIDSKRFSRLRTSRARPRLLRFTAVRCRSIEQDGLWIFDGGDSVGLLISFVCQYRNDLRSGKSDKIAFIYDSGHFRKGYLRVSWQQGGIYENF